jgi:hypothetical protein
MKEVTMDEDDIDRFLKKASKPKFDAKATERWQRYRGRRQQEAELHQQWVERGKKVDDPALAQLLDSLDPVLNREVNKRIRGLAGSVSPIALKSELQREAAKALHRFDPSKGAMPAYVGRSFQATTDFVNRQRNAGYMTKAKSQALQEFKNRTLDFEQQHGRPPNLDETARLFPEKPRSWVKSMTRGFGAEHIAELPGGLEGDHAKENLNRYQFLWVRRRLGPRTRRIGEKLFPVDDTKARTPKQIAKDLGVSQWSVYRAEKAIVNEIAKRTPGGQKK